MKKGFTLIELLAVIVILAIILAIAIPAISSIIDNSKVNAYKNDNAALVKYAKVYLLNNSEKLPINVGDTTEVTLDNLKDSRMLSNMKSPFDKSKDCNGYILVTKMGENNYDYSPNLNCTTNIASSAEDSLLYHYKFDDFQEPTQNLITNLSPSVSPWGTPAPTGTSTYFTTPSGSQGISANIVYNGSGGFLYGYTNSVNVSGSTQYTVSAVVKWEGTSTPSANLFYLRQYRSDNSQISELGYYSPTKLISIGNGWYKAYNTFTTAADATRIQFQSYQYSTLNIWIYDFQLEQKKYFTPYVSGIRTNNINNYTLNNFDIPLVLNTTPQWINAGLKGSGAYDFNGTSSRMDSTQNISISGSQPRTIIGWINTRNGSAGTSQFTTLASHGTTDTGNDFSLGIKSNKVAIGYWGSYTEGNTLIDNNKWYQIAATYDGNKTRLYLNGGLDGEEIKIVNTPIGTLKIGNRSNNVHTFDGLIDDIRIYNRVLSEEEIKILYESAK